MGIYDTEEKEYVSLQDMNVIDNFMFNELTMQKNKEKGDSGVRHHEHFYGK